MKSTSTTRHAMHFARYVAIGMTVMLLASCGLFLSESAQLKRAQEAQKRGDLRAASIDLKSLLEKHPDNREARYLLGVVELDSGDFVGAARELERARKQGIPDVRVVEPLARSYAAQREFDKGLQLLDAELGNTGSAAPSAEARVNYQRMRGEILFAKRDFAGARSALESALADSPNDAAALLALTGVVEATEGAEAALKINDRALAASPKDAATHLARGALLLQLKKNTDAADSFQQAVDLAAAPTQKTQLLSSLAGLAQAQIAGGQNDAALKTTTRMQELAPNSPLTRYSRAYALAQNNQLDQARELLEQNVSQVEDMRSRLLLGAVNLTLGRNAQAEMHLAAVVAAAPENVEARQLLAESRLRQSKPADALDALLPAIGNGSSASANMLALAGQASLASGKTKEGVELLKRNAEAHPDSARAQLDLAAGYLAAGQTDQALTVLGGEKSPGTTQKDNAKEATSSAESELQLVRREYLTVLARSQKGDVAGATAHAIKVAQDNPTNPSLQALASAVLTTQHQFAKARTFAESAIRLNPNEAAGYTNLGRINLLDGQVDTARQNFRTALEKRPGDALAASSLALLELSKQNSDAALAVLSEARKHNAKSIEPRVLETQILLARGKLEDAEKLARDTVALANDNATALAALARVLSVQGRHSEALETFERAVRIQPKSVPLRLQMATAQRSAGRFDDALNSAREALRIDAHSVPAMQFEGLLSAAKGDLATASRRSDELLKIAPDDAVTHELAATVRMMQRRYADAATEYAKAGEHNPQPQYAIGEFQARVQGKLPTPEAPLEKFLSAHPTDVATRVVLAQAQQQRGDRAAAMSSYEFVLTNQPKNPVALNNLAWMHFEDRKPDAIDLARRAHDAAPAAQEVTDTYAWILVNSGKVTEGLKLFESLFQSGKKNGERSVASEIRAHYAVTLARAGRTAEAKALAKDLAANNGAELSPDAHTLLADLIKS